MSDQNSSWSQSDRQKLIDATKNHTNWQGLISWQNVAKEFPERTKLQCKSYYQNILKDRNQVYNKFKKLSIQNLALFCMRLLQCDENYEKVQKMFYPNRYVDEIKQWQMQAEQAKIDAFGSTVFVLRYPDTDYKFDKSKLDAMKEFILVSIKFNNIKNMSDKMQEFQKKMAQMPMQELLRKIDVILMKIQ